VLVICGGSDASTTRRSGDIRFSVSGVAPSGVTVKDIETSVNSGPGGVVAKLLSRDAHLPYHTTLRIVDPRATLYALNVGLAGHGHLTCTIRIGRISDTGHVTGLGPRKSVLCVAILQWSARLGRWVPA